MNTCTWANMKTGENEIVFCEAQIIDTKQVQFSNRLVFISELIL